MSGYSGSQGGGGGSDRGRQPGGGSSTTSGRTRDDRSVSPLGPNSTRSRPPGPRNPNAERQDAEFRARHPEDHAPSSAPRGRGAPPGGAPPASTPSSLPPTAQIPEGAGPLNYPEFVVRNQTPCKVNFMVSTNHHVIKSLPKKAIWAYDLTITISADSKHKGLDEASVQQRARVLLKREVLDFFGDKYVFDGVSQIWTPDLLFPEGESRHQKVAMEPRRDGLPNNMDLLLRNKGRLNVGDLARWILSASVEIDPAGVPALENPIKWLQACFRKDPASRLVTRPNSNAYFNRDPATTMALRSTSGVLEARRGVFQTMQVRFGRLTMNVDTATTPFWVPNKCLLDFATALLGYKSPQQLLTAAPAVFRTRASKMCGIYFHVRHLGEKARDLKLKMRSFSNTNADTTSFDERQPDGSTVKTTVTQYFARKYNIKLRYPSLPLVSTTKGDFPLEVCFSADGERYKELLQGSETADFIKFATCLPGIRKSQIEHNMRLLAHHNNETLRAHGLSLEPTMMTMPAKVLTPATLHYGNNRKMTPLNGKWNLRGMSFQRPSNISSWVMLYIQNGTSRPLEDAKLTTFLNQIPTQFRAVGMNVPKQAPPYLVCGGNINMPVEVNRCINRAKEVFNRGPDVIFFVLQSSSTIHYQLIKMGMDVKLGIASQVMLEEKAFKSGGAVQYIANISMKVNVKLGGTNCNSHNPMFDAAPTMLLGGDISHASPGALRLANPPPSCSALVGTWDKACTAYTAVVGMQESTHSMIANIKPMFAELIKRYTEKNNGIYPRHIIYFRDGVSESEFKEIKNGEAKQLKNLLTELGQNSKITLIVAIKRHHTRFFPPAASAPGTSDPKGNVPAGTCVENSRDKNDVYIVAQPELIGTKRPTRYVSVVDESLIAPYQFQMLCHNLCSSYARATTAVAVCPPIYYADQACERARLHLQQPKGNPNGPPRLEPVHRNLRWNMWWQ